MVAFNQIKHRQARHVCVYGPPKIGKSRLVGMLAEAGYLLDWFDLESGSSVLTQLSEEAQSRINLIRIPDTKDWPIAIETMLKVSKFQTQKPYKICDKHGKIDCPLCVKIPEAIWSEVDFSKYTDKHVLVVDTANQLTQSALAQITKDKDIEYKLLQDDWGRLGMLLGYFFGNVQNCRFNVVVNTHEMVTETTQITGDKNEKIFPLAGTGNFSRTFGKYFDDVVHMDIFNRRHRATSSTLAKPLVLTGSRSNISIETMDNPSLIPLFTGELPLPSTNEKAVSLLKGIKS